MPRGVFALIRHSPIYISKTNNRSPHHHADERFVDVETKEVLNSEITHTHTHNIRFDRNAKHVRRMYGCACPCICMHVFELNQSRRTISRECILFLQVYAGLVKYDSNSDWCACVRPTSYRSRNAFPVPNTISKSITHVRPCDRANASNRKLHRDAAAWPIDRGLSAAGFNSCNPKRTCASICVNIFRACYANTETHTHIRYMTII